MNCPFRYRDGAVMFHVVGDLLQEEKLVALSRNLELDLVFTSVETVPASV
jgi:hypothetical protein